ncbi:putative ligand-binding protein with streptavidin-like fold [Ancylobacter aquaticus]|uniref:Putative ligand-binding protein with streptavidin-like fold n=1 Tax=Ancylobacter aquaticus TaxID=100 RepID=A0A4V2PJF8_ANCAQ|nr:Atu4866 domain-containing protein [Ancylobacter aquaticus]TCK28296.1 putative ligand-binding protein with streptavidin-like fold [Ancylobacter aquaticus]
MKPIPQALLLAALIASPFLPSLAGADPAMTQTHAAQTQPDKSHPYVGMWVTPDGHIRHELLPNGRYDEARGTRQSAYRGRYEVRGTHIDYWDDTGFTADGTFVDANTLHHGGMVFRRVD